MATRPTRTQPKRNRAGLSGNRVFNSTSPVTEPGTNLHGFFQHCIANWDNLYSEEEKAEIIATLPPPYRRQCIKDEQSGKITCPLSLDFVIRDRVFLDNIPRFQRDVKDGYWTATWQTNARKASKERTQGKFDEYLRTHAEEMYGDGHHVDGPNGPDGHGENEDDHQPSSDGEYQGEKSNAQVGKVRREGEEGKKGKANTRKHRGGRTTMNMAMHVDESADEGGYGEAN